MTDSLQAKQSDLHNEEKIEARSLLDTFKNNVFFRNGIPL